MTQEQKPDLVQKQAAEAKLDSDVHYEQVRLLYEQSPKILLISYVLALAILVTFWRVADHVGLSVWFIVFMTYNIARLAMVSRGIKSLPKTRESVKMGNAYALSSLISGLLWGSLMFFMQPTWPLIYQVMLLLIMLGVSSVTILSYGVHLYSYLALLIPIISSSAISLMLFDDANYRISVLFFLIFGFQLFSSAKSFNKNLTETLRSRFRERTLINELTNANNQLGQEIIAREQVQSELREAKEEAEAANQAKSVFLANMSHELRTPLNAILGFSEMMAHDPDASSAQKDKVAIINRSGAHLLGMINDVLDLSKIEAGQAELEPEVFDLPRMLEDIGRMFEMRAESAQLRFELELDPGLAQTIKSDIGKLRQILINLLDNAVKFTEQGDFSLHARTLPISDDPAMVNLQLEVKDSGRGIVAEQLDHIFEPFRQAGHSSSVVKGTGLGLAITKSFVELMGGQIRVESEVGKGSLFQVELPVALAEATEVGGLDMSRPAVLGLQAGQTAWRILVVEDNLENRLLLSSLLVQTGFEVREAENGEQALTQFEQWQPHFIWMDMSMPVMDGYEATAEIRKLPRGDKVKIVAITASVFKEQHKTILDAGCDEVLHKPFQSYEIFDTMAEQLAVRYIYEEQMVGPAAMVEQTINIAKTKEMMVSLPDQLKNELKQAATALDMEEAYEVIERVAKLQPDLAGILKLHVDEMDFSSIKRVLD